MALDIKLKKLETILKDKKHILVALSGGVDSAFLLAYSVKVLGHNNVAAITAFGPNLAPDEIEYSQRLCQALNVEHILWDCNHLIDVIRDNPPDRCYYCKRSIFSDFSSIALKNNMVLVDGTNSDDMSDYRPGHRALQEINVFSPLKDAGMSKCDIRTALEKLSQEDTIPNYSLLLDDGTPLWKKPAFACLASRIPYGEEITKEKLSAIYTAEKLLKEKGFRQVRVRHHKDIARIELPYDELQNMFDCNFMRDINEKIKSLGFKYVTLDLGGYRMGSLNEVLSEKSKGNAK